VDREERLKLAPASKERRFNVLINLCFVLAIICAFAFAVVYWTDDSIQWEGISFGLFFLLVGAGLTVWSHHFLPEGPFEEEYPELRSPPEEEAEVLASFDRGGVGRRRLLLTSLGIGGAAMVGAIVSSFRSLGPGPFAFASTPWKGGKYCVDPDGNRVKVTDVPVNSFVTVYPEGFTNSPMAPVDLIHLPPGKNRPLKGRQGWAPHNFVAYSKVCSHAGCPVNQYNASQFQLHCPCHQSTFNVLDGAMPVFGPAGGPLAQLPLAVDAHGYLRSTGDFSFPPGPVYWHYSRTWS
jgi:ubiquinol-cytochrome c reductase iron-sulfur subunit